MMGTAHTPKRHMNLMSVVVLVPCLLLVAGNAVFAEPYLQLDANPAVYVSAPEESIVTTQMDFTLYALVNSEKKAFDFDDTFYLSVAIVPDLPQTPPPAVGSFVFDGVTINVGAPNMEYGTPPLENELAEKGLPGHGIFETYYWVHSFTLDADKRANLYNSQDNPGGPGPIVDDGPLYYQDFEVDATGLISGNNLHFDLYTLTTNNKGELVIADFAPFSHDVLTAPVPGALILGMFGLAVVGLKLRKFA